MSGFRTNLLRKYVAGASVSTRYIQGTAYAYNNIAVSLDGGTTWQQTTADENGNWQIDIAESFVITTLEKAFSGNTEEGGYGNNVNITSIDLSHIGDTSQCTSLAHAFDSCIAATSINLGTIDTSNVTTMINMFNSCRVLQSLNASVLSTASIPADTGVGNMTDFLYCDTVSALTELSLPSIPVYVSSNFFYNCTNLTTIHSCGTIKQRFKCYVCPLTRASALVLINALSATTPSTPNLHLHPDTYSQLSAEDIAIATAKGWTVVSGNS